MNKKDNAEIRDERKIPFTMVDNYIVDSMSFKNPTDKLLYICLCRFSHMNQIFPSIGKLMLMVGVSSPNTLKAALERLKEMGLIKWKVRPKDNGEYNTHLYTLLEVPEVVIENSVFVDDMVKEKKLEIKAARKEKAEKTNHNKHVKKKNDTPSNFDVPPSNSDGPDSNFDGPSSNFDEPGSNFEQDKEESINQTLKQEFTKQEFSNLSILEKISDLDVPMPIKVCLKRNQKRLIDDNINLLDISFLFKAYEDKLKENKFALILDDVLVYTKAKIGSIKAVLKKSINEELKPSDKVAKKPVRIEMVPEWHESYNDEEQVKLREAKSAKVIQFKKPVEETLKKYRSLPMNLKYEYFLTLKPDERNELKKKLEIWEQGDLAQMVVNYKGEF